MKFSVVSAIILVHGIVAMPWTSKQSNGGEITLRIKVSDGSFSNLRPNPKGTVHVENDPECLKICWLEKPTCPRGWAPKDKRDEHGECCTCCKEKEGDDL